jgi:CMP-N,N'-diacetyllegionaminic acid synthase
MNAPRVLAIVSARGGSKGVPRKNLHELVPGEALVATAVRKAIATPGVDRVVCMTDDGEIAAAARAAGAETPFREPDHLAQGNIPLITVTQHALWAMDETGYRADVVAQIAPTSPFIRRTNYAAAIEAVVEDRCECAVSLKRIEHEHPYRARVVDDEGYFSNFITDLPVESFHSRQDLPTLYCTSGGLYVRQRHLLDRYDGSDFALGDRRLGILVDDIEAINIDRPIDLEFAEFMIATGRIGDDHLR